MVDTVRYVRTDSPAGGNGTEDDSGAGNPNRAYPGLEEWQSSEIGTVATGDTHTVLCTSPAGDVDPVRFVFTGWVVDDPKALRIKGHPTNPGGRNLSDTLWDASAYTTSFNNISYAFLHGQNNGLVEGIQIENTRFNQGVALTMSNTTAGPDCYVNACRLRAQGGGVSFSPSNRNNVLHVVTNCVYVTDPASFGGICLNVDASLNPVNYQAYIYNNTSSVGNEFGIRVNTDAGSGTIRLRNNATFNNAGPDWTELGGGTIVIEREHNAADDAPLNTDTGGVDLGDSSVTWDAAFVDPENTTYENKNLSVEDAASVLNDAGVTGLHIPTLDINDVVRDATPSIGAFEWVDGGPVIPATSYQMII